MARWQRSSPRRAALIATVALCTVVAGGCGHRQPSRAAPPRQASPSYRWPPPGGASFCTSLLDSYEHLATAQHAPDLGRKAAVVSSFAAYAPILVGDAPPSIRADAAAYLTPVSTFLAALAADGMDLQAVPAPTIEAIEVPAVAQAQAHLVSFARATCGYDLGAGTGGPALGS